jgi:hypothetical protein
MLMKHMLDKTFISIYKEGCKYVMYECDKCLVYTLRGHNVLARLAHIIHVPGRPDRVVLQNEPLIEFGIGVWPNGGASMDSDALFFPLVVHSTAKN